MISARTLKLSGYVLLIFLSGLLTGAFLAPSIGRRFLRPPPPGEMSRHMLARMQSRLNLTPEQKEQVKPLVEAAANDIDAIRKETTARVSDRIAQNIAAINALLTPDQQRELEKMEAERKAHMHHGEPFGPPPPPPPPPKR